MTEHIPWEKKYAPQTIDDMVLDSSISKLIKDYLAKGTINNLAFTGRPGIGKTTLALLIAKELGAYTKFICASRDRGVGVVKGEIEEFATRATIDGDLKIIILDEADNMTSDAYDALRNTIPENVDDTRFILTGNTASKIPPAILSRCKDFNLKFDFEGAKGRLEQILLAEAVKFSKENFNIFCETILKKVFPDMRKAIGYLETMSISGSLIPLDVNNTDSMQDVIAKALQHRNASEARAYLIQNEDEFNADWLGLAHTFFDICAPNSIELSKMDPMSIAQSEYAMRIIAEWITKMETGTSREIYFAGLLIDYYKVRNSK